MDACLTRSDFKAKGITKRKCCPLHERADNNADEFYMKFNERLYDAALACSVYGLHLKIYQNPAIDNYKYLRERDSSAKVYLWAKIH